MPSLNLTRKSARLAAMTIVAVALAMMPGAEFFSTHAAFCGVWMCVEFAYSRMEWKSDLGWYSLLAAMTLTAVGVVANVYGYTTLAGASTSEPYLFNTDHHRYFYDSLALMGGNVSDVHEYQYGYSYLIIGIWKITGISIVPLLVINQAAMMFTLIFCGGLAAEVAGKNRNLPNIAIILCASVCYLLNHSTLLLKESLITLALVAFCYSMLSSKRKSWFILIFSIILFGLIRSHWLPYLLVALLFVNHGIFKTKTSAALGLIAVLWYAFYLLYHGDYGSQIISGDDIQSAYVSEEEGRGAFWTLIGDYFSYPVWKRILLMPLCAVVQIVTPFPWNFERDMVYGMTQWYSHVAYPWYGIAGIIAYYLGCDFLKGKMNTPLKRLTIAGLLLWLIPVYLFAGSVSRYSLVAVPLLVPCAAYIIANGYYRRKSFIFWAAAYSAIMAAGLITIYSLIS